MYSVTKRIAMIKQPYGGYINKKQFAVTQLEDHISLNENENIHASLVGSAIDYMTRFLMGTEKEEAFSISLEGAKALDLFKADKKRAATKNAEKLLAGINGINKKTVINACKLTGYDVCYRSRIGEYKPVKEICPDADTVENIITMINRSLSFWKEYGPIVKDGFTFEGGYTNTISEGDGDYLTNDTLWDFKVIKSEPKPKHTLQLFVYYIMGKHSVYKEFRNIKKLGIYNPRMNKVYTVEISSIPERVIEEVSKKVIGY